MCKDFLFWGNWEILVCFVMLLVKKLFMGYKLSPFNVLASLLFLLLAFSLIFSKGEDLGWAQLAAPFYILGCIICMVLDLLVQSLIKKTSNSYYHRMCFNSSYIFAILPERNKLTLLDL